MLAAELMLLRNAIVSRCDFAESYAKPFKACAKAKALGVMCAYNQAQGAKANVGHSSSVYSYANEEILRFWTSEMDTLLWIGPVWSYHCTNFRVPQHRQVRQLLAPPEVNGVPSCGSKRLLRGLLREKWGFDGVVVTDCDSISVSCHAETLVSPRKTEASGGNLPSWHHTGNFHFFLDIG